MSENIKIFVGYHKPYQLLDSNIFIPIHLGRAVALEKAKDGKSSKKDVEWLESNTIGDDTGDNISDKNRYYCELTGIYWIWKHYKEIGDPKYVGFMHYRRHFIFNDEVFRSYVPMEKHERPYAKINVGNMYDGYIDDFGLSDKNVRQVVEKYDAILPVSCDLRFMGIHSIREDYVKLIPGTKEKDLNTLVKVVKKVAPEYSRILEMRLTKPDKRCYQSFVLKKEIFFDYCNFLFRVLSEVEKHVNVSHYSINGKRTMGYLGEILFDTYMYNLKNNPKLHVKELGMTYLQESGLPRPIKPRTAIVQLAYADYESLEISLANFCKYFDDTTKFFILQNGRGTYDTERTYRTAKRYERLYPNNIEVVDDIPPQRPFYALKELFNSKRLEGFDYICKVDDDVFPVRADWFDKLCECYEDEFAHHGDNLAYASGLVNNNPFGFKQLVTRNKQLHDEYYSKYARLHRAGNPVKNEYYQGPHIVQKEEIDDDVCGTVWQLPYLARWIHKKTTLLPDSYIEMCNKWPVVKLRNKRYSINVMLFDKDFWNRIDNGRSDDDELLSEQYCKTFNKYVAVDLSNPFSHLFFFSQREENRDLIDPIRDLYEKRLEHSYPVALQSNRVIENENRLRDIDANSNARYNEYVRRVHKNGKKVRTAIKDNPVVGKTWRLLPYDTRQSIKHIYRKARRLE